MKKLFLVTTTTLCAVAILFSLGTLDARAASTGLTIQPVKISYDLKPGETASGTISLTNASDAAVNVDMKVEDFVPLAGSYNIQFVGRAEGVTTVRDWVLFSEPVSFVLGKGAAKEIAYTIKAPLDAEPGGHFGVALFKATERTSGSQIKVGTQVGVLLFVTVPGDHLQKGKVLNFSGPQFVQKGPVVFQIKFENTGTVHFEPKGSIKITDIFGREAGNVPVGGQAVLPTGVRDLSATWNVAGTLFGRYRAALSMVDAEGIEIGLGSIAFWAFPLWYVAGFFAAVLILFFLIRLLKRKVKISLR